MTYKDFVEQYGSDDAKQILALIVAVIKKREPKPPAEIDDEYGYFKCPTCGELIYCAESRFEDHKYCLNCGQAIYWRKKEVFNQSTARRTYNANTYVKGSQVPSQKKIPKMPNVKSPAFNSGSKDLRGEMKED